MRKGLGGQRFTLFGELERDGRGAARHRPRGGEEQCRRYELRPDQSRIPLPANRCPRLLSGSGQQQSGSRKVVAAEGCSALSRTRKLRGILPIRQFGPHRNSITGSLAGVADVNNRRNGQSKQALHFATTALVFDN